ncbi:MAG: RHS repeat protein [Planctomycetes bacterium]|nr:RHS repeat protein [Planctomycetota bacterium]
MGERAVDPAVPHRNASEVGPGVRLASGSVYHVQTDLSTSGRVMGLCMRRVYRSDMQFDGPLGQGWTGDLFQAAWRDEASGDLLWHDADGFLHTFVSRSDAWRSPPGVYARASFENDAVSLRRADGTVLDFTDCGLLSTITDRNGNAITLQYDAAHQLQYVLDDRGYSWEFVHDGNGRISRLIDHVWETDTRDPRTVEYEYDAAGRLIRVKLPETARYSDANSNRVTREYEYDAEGRLLRVFAPNGVGTGVARTEYEYDIAGRVVSFRDGDATAWHYLRYTQNANEHPLIRHIDPRGVRTDYTLDKFGRATKIQQYTGFWGVNHDEPLDHDFVVQTATKLRTSDPNVFVTKHRFNRGHQLTRIDHPAGDCEEFTYPDPTKLARAHATSIVGGVITLDGAEWAAGEFAGGYVRLGGSLAEFEYYEVAGNTEDTLSVAGVDLNAQGWGDGAKFVVFTENPDKLAAGNLLEHRWISTDADQPDITESFTYEPYYQQLRTATSRRGYITSYEYGFDTTGDPADGNLAVKRTPGVTVRLPDGTTQIAVYETHYGYNAFGQLVSTIDPERSIETRTYYASGDQAGFLESIRRADGDLDLTDAFEYDKTGILTGQYPPAAFEPGATADDFKTNWEVNELDRRWHETGPIAAGTQRIEVYRYFDASGNETRTWRNYVTSDGNAPAAPGDPHDPDTFSKNSAPMSPTWAEVTRSFDLGDRLLSETSDAVAGAPVETVTRTSEYDALGNRTAKISPLLHRTGWEYDERNLVIRRIEGDGSAVEGVYETDYSLNGGVAAERTPLGNETTHSFDGFGRERQVTDPAGAKTEFSYDANGNVISERHADSADVTLKQTDWEYDELDRVNGKSVLAKDANGVPIASGSEETILTLDGRGAITALNNGPSRTWLFGYDAARRLISRTDPAGNEVALTLNANSDPTRIDYTDVNQATGALEFSHWEADYNALGLAVNVRDRRYQGAGFDTTVMFAYDGWSRLVRITEAGGNLVQYSYDLRSRPVERTEGPAGILFSDAKQEWDRDDRVARSSVGMDPLGGPDFQSTSYGYDERGRVTGVTRPDLSAAGFKYDADSNPVGLEDETGTSVSQVFDARGLLSVRTIVPAGGTVGAMQEAYEYDGMGRTMLAETYEAEEMTTRTEWTWNTLGRPETRTLTLGDGNGGTPGQWSTLAVSDVHGSVVREGFSDGFQLARHRDELSRTTTVTDTLLSADLFNLLWAGPARIAHQDNLNGTSTQVDYETGFSGLPRRIDHKRGAQTLWGFDYRHDLRGLETRQRRDHEGGTGRVQHLDPARRMADMFAGADLAGALLDGAADPTSYGLRREFTYQAPGNRTSVSDSAAGGAVRTQAYEISGDLMNRYVLVDDFALGCDAGARVTFDASAGAYHAWDFRSRLSLVDDDADMLSPSRRFVYDAQGRRVLEDELEEGVLESRTVILYGADDRPLEEIQLDAADVETGRVQYARNGEDILAERVDGAWRWRHLDADGSLVGLTDAAGERTALFDYRPFGMPMRAGVTADVAPSEITDVEADTPVAGITRIHVTQTLSGDLLGHELAISVPAAATERYRTTTVVGFTANTLDVADADGLIEDALSNLGAGFLALESRLSLVAPQLTYDAGSDTTEFTVPGAGFESALAGGTLVPNTSLPGWFDVVAVDAGGDSLTVRGNLENATATGDHWRVLPPHAGDERYLYRGFRYDAVASEGAGSRVVLYASSGRSYDPRLGRWLTPSSSMRNPYAFAPWGVPLQVSPRTGAQLLCGTWSPSRPSPAQPRVQQGYRFAVPEMPGLSG